MTRASLAALTLLVLGCESGSRHPWDQGDAATPPAPPPPRPAASESLLPASSASAASAAEPEIPPPAGPATIVEGPAVPVRVGGPWVRCYGNFRASGDPVKDVTRLSMLCGPENGMKRLSERPFEGTVAEGAPALTETFEARRGECYRVFAVATGISDLDVVVRSSRGAPIAADHTENAWPIVQPDRPFCPLADDRYTLEVSAHTGSGRFAAEVWVLKSAPPK